MGVQYHFFEDFEAQMILADCLSYIEFQAIPMASTCLLVSPLLSGPWLAYVNARVKNDAATYR